MFTDGRTDEKSNPKALYEWAHDIRWAFCLVSPYLPRFELCDPSLGQPLMGWLKGLWTVPKKKKPELPILTLVSGVRWKNS